MSQLTWNNNTGNYEGSWGGQSVIINGDVMSETQNTNARELFGVDYADTDSAQQEAVDKECLDPFAWIDTDDNEGKPFDMVDESMKAHLVDRLCEDNDVEPRWTAQAAWQAAEDPANWEYDAEGNVRANVITGSDQYGE
jgi:hypothetical protein